jgi:type IV secretory pathway VirB2 component (pilin)
MLREIWAIFERGLLWCASAVALVGIIALGVELCKTYAVAQALAWTVGAVVVIFIVGLLTSPMGNSDYSPMC